MSHPRQFLPYLALAVGILSLGFSALFVRWANVPGPVMGVYRLGIASLVMAPLFIWRRWGKARLTKWALSFALLGGLLTALDHAFWNTAVLYTTAANATLFGNTAPLWVALAAWLLFKEQLKPRFWIGLALTLTGAVVVLGSDFLLHPDLGLGDLIALGAAIFYGGSLLVTQRGRPHLDTPAGHHRCLAGLQGKLGRTRCPGGDRSCLSAQFCRGSRRAVDRHRFTLARRKIVHFRSKPGRQATESN